MDQALMDYLEKKFSSIEQRFDSMDSRIDELKEIVVAVRHGQEFTNAKLEALTMDVRKLQGNVADLKEHKQDMEFVRRIRQAATEDHMG